VFPTFGAGWFNQSALLAHRDGRGFEQVFTGCRIEWQTPERVLRLILTDDLAAIEVGLVLTLDNDVLTLATVLTNTGDTALDVQWLASGVIPLPDTMARVHAYGGRHLNEFHPQTDQLGRGLWRRENRRGLTSHDAFPGAVVAAAITDAHAGLTYGAQLAWSGNHVQTLEWLDDGRYQWQMGVWLAPGEGRLAPGASLAAPPMVAACSRAGLNGVAAAFHRDARARMTWPGGAMRPRPVSLNTWEGNYFRHDFAALTAQAALAAEIGVERFVLDDGWFHRRHGDDAGLGDWRPDAGKYPDGLGPLIDAVRALGLEFGLWVEPEMVNPDSDLYRAHPDWTLGVAGRPLITARNQLVLDMARVEVRDHLFAAIDLLLKQHPIAYLKWDHNRALTAAGGADGRASYVAQVQGAYALFDRLRAAHPHVEIEACAGGGGRIDLGILDRTHRFWTSDCIDARARVTIQRGFLQFLPPEVMGAHVGASPAHTTSRRQGMAFRAAVALPGHFGVELDLTTLDDRARAGLARWVAFYKQWRGRLHAGRVWLGEAADGLPWQAHGDEDANEVLLFVLRLEPQTLRHAPAIRLPMLSGSGRYRVTPLTPLADQARDEDNAFTASGEWLREVGFVAAPMAAEHFRLFHIALMA
jgi:alpha-galactosidase